MARTKKDVAKSVFNAFNKAKEGKTNTADISGSRSRRLYIGRAVDTAFTNAAVNFDTLGSDLNSLATTINEVYNGWQTPETMQNTLQSVQQMRTRLGKYQEYQKRYGGTDLSELYDGYEKVIADWDTLADEYGKYKDANAHKAEQTKLTELFSMTSEEIKPYLEEAKEVKGNAPKTVKEFALDLKNRHNGEKSASPHGVAYTTADGQNITWKALYEQKKREEEYTAVTSDPDFAKYRDVGKNVKNPTARESVGWGAKKVVNVLEFADKYKVDMAMAAANGETTLPVNMAYCHATQEERDVYNYYLGQELEGKVGKGTAKKYLNSIFNTLEERMNGAMTEALTTVGEEHPILASTLSIPSNIVSAAASISNGIKYLRTGELDTNYAANMTTALRTGVTNAVDWKIGGWDAFDFAYGAGMSLADTYVASALFGTVGGGTELGLSAAGQASNDALARGLDDDEAFWTGATAGVFEALFETVSIGNFKALKEAPVDSIKSVIKNVGKSMLVNASEEALTEFANLCYDYFANGDFSQYETNIRAYMSAGMSEGEAKRKVAQEQALQIAEAAASGALVGGVLGGSGGTIAYTNSKHIGQNIKANGRVGELFDIASNPEVASAYDAYTRYAKKGVNANNISDVQVGNLYSMARMDAEAVLMSKESTAEQKMNAQEILDSINMYARKESLSKKEIKKAYGKDAEAVETLIAQGLESSKDTESYKLATEYKAKLEEGKRLTADEISSLIDAKEQAIKDEEIAEIKGLEEIGESPEVVDIVARKVRGETITTKEAGKLNANEKALQVLAENTDGEIVDIVKAMDKNDANLFMALYDGKTDIEAYANDFNLVSEYSDKGYTAEWILNHKGVLSAEQVKGIYKEKRIKADRAAANKILALNAKMASSRLYEGIIDDSVIDYNNTSAKGRVNWNKLSYRQRQAVTFIKGLAKAMGANLVLTHNSESKTGGSYDPSNNTLTIDIAKFKHVEKGLIETIIPTMSHELTHWMEKKAPKLWREINELVFSTLEKAGGLSEFERIQNEIKKQEKKGRVLSEEEARSEIIARACEDMLSMSKEGRKLFNSLPKAEQNTLVEKIKDIIQKLKDWVNELLSSYKPTSYEAKVMRGFEAELNRLSELWDKMLVSSVKANQSLEKSGAFKHETNVEGDVKFSEREIIGISGKSYGMGVYLDSNLLTGLAETERKQMVKEFVVTELSGKHFIAYDNNNNAVDIGIASSKARMKTPNGKNKRVVEELYRKNIDTSIKQEAVVLADELIQTAKYDKSKTPKHQHDWVDNYGKNDWDYWKVYIQEKNKSVWEATLNIANTANGEKILYDVDPIKKVEQAVESATSATNNSIPNSDENVKKKFSDRDSEGSILTKEQQKYTYEALVAKRETEVTTLESVTPLEENKYKSNYDLFAKDMRDIAAEKGNPKNTDQKTYLYCKDLDGNVLITKQSFKHGAARLDNAYISVCKSIADILNTSIVVNELAEREKTNGAYVLLGLAENKDSYVVVRSIVNKKTWNLEEYEELYAIKKKSIEKGDVGLIAPALHLKSGFGTSPTISISNFLDFVNSQPLGSSVLSLDVVKNLNSQRAFDENVTPYLLHSDREDISTYDVMGEKERLLKENEKFKADIERLSERLKIERKVTKGNFFNENQLGAVAGHLRNISKSTIDKTQLIGQLKDVYSFIVQSPDLVWEEVFGRCYDVAAAMLEEAKPEVVVDDYAKKLLDEIRTTRVAFNDVQKAEAKHIFGKNWNRYFFGKVTITDEGTPLDIKWQEWAHLYPDIFDAEALSNDMAGKLYETISLLKESSETIMEYNEEEQRRWLAREIYNQYWNVSPIRTTADKYDKQIKRLNFEHRKAMSEFRKEYNEKLKAQHKADMAHSKEMQTKIRDHRDEKLKAQHKEDRQRAIELYNKIRERKDKEVAAAKEHGKAKLAAYKENAERKTRIQRITSNAFTLKKWLTNNSKEYHIHEAMKGPVIKLLTALDFSSKSMLEKGLPTEIDVTFAEAFSDVKSMLDNATNMAVGFEELYGHDLAESIELLSKAAFKFVGDNEYVINSMTNEQLYHLDKLVRHIKSVVTRLNKFHILNHNQGAVSLADEFMEHGKKLGNIKKQYGKIGKFLEFRNRTPYYFFKDLGHVGVKLFEAFQDGWDKLAFNAKKIIDFTKATYTRKEVREWSKETKTFTLTQLGGSERTIEMSTAQIMALYCVSKQKAGQAHLLSGGMTLKRIDKKGHVVADYENVTLSISDMHTIISSLTDRQKEVADALQKFMNTVCSEWGNEISMARFGVKMFSIPDYFPIKVSEANVPTDNTKDIDNASMFRLLNMSFTKAREEGATESIEIADIFDVFAQHSSDMAKYNALALPILDFNKFYSIHGKDVANKEYGVVNTLKSVFGDEANGYIRRFIRDINGSQNVSRDVIGNTFFKNAKVAAVAANLRVILLQPTAFHKAGAVLDNKYLLKASAYMKVEPVGMYKRFKKAIEKAEKYCGIVQWKSLGYYDTDISKGLTEKIKHADSFKDKVIEKSMKGAELADKATFGTLWVACEFEIREKRKDLKVGSKDFYNAVGKRLREVIYATQVVDSTMTRSDMMRSSDKWDKVLTTFASEPIIAYNMLLDCATQFHRDKQEFDTKTAVHKNLKKVRKVITAYVITNAITALVESVSDVWRDDDEMDIEQFLKLYLKNFAYDMSIGNKLPGIKEAYSIFQGYSSSRMDTQWLQYIQYAVNAKKPETAFKNLLNGFSQMTGLPFYNVYRDTMAMLNKLDIFTKDDLNEMFEGFLD